MKRSGTLTLPLSLCELIMSHVFLLDTDRARWHDPGRGGGSRCLRADLPRGDAPAAPNRRPGGAGPLAGGVGSARLRGAELARPARPLPDHELPRGLAQAPPAWHPPAAAAAPAGARPARPPR